MTSIQLQEEQAKAWKAYTALREKRDGDGKFADQTDEAAFRKAGEAFDSYAERIIDAKKDEERQKRMIEADFQDEKRAKEKKDSSAEDEKRMAYDAVYGRWLTRGQNATMNPEEQRVLETRGTNTQIVTTNSLGGYLVPQQFSNELEVMGLWSGGMMQGCRIYDDTVGGVLPWPTADDTATNGEIVGQGVAANVSDLTIGNVLFNDFTIDSKIIKVARELIRDERVGLLRTVLAELLAERLSRKNNTVLTNGTGTGEPYGLTVASTSIGLTTASATAITASELVNMLYSVDKYYAAGSKVAWMMHRTTLAYLRTLDFTTNTTHLFADRVIAGEPEMLLGYPVIINNDLPATSGGLPVALAKHIYFGDFSKYVIRRIGGVTIDRNDSVYWTSRTAGFMGWMSIDGNLLNQNAIKALKQHA
jgi:HK97 family phage major capsid protein